MGVYRKKKTFRLPVTAANKSYTKEFELPTHVQTVIGLAVSSNQRGLAWKRGQIGVEIAGVELIEEGEDAAEYIYGSNHPARFDAFGELPVTASDRRVRVRFKDTDADGANFMPYEIRLIVSYYRNR